MIPREGKAQGKTEGLFWVLKEGKPIRSLLSHDIMVVTVLLHIAIFSMIEGRNLLDEGNSEGRVEISRYFAVRYFAFPGRSSFDA